MGRSFGLLYLLLLTLGSPGQGDNRILTQFNFMQIDSLASSAIAKHILTGDFVVVQTNWSVGVWQIPDDSNYVACENPFDMYILYKKQDVYYQQHLDNFGYFEPLQIDGEQMTEFLKNHFESMKTEKLVPPLDGSEHQLVRKIKIYFVKDSIQYELPADYSKNKLNTRTNQYKFMSLFEKQQKQLRKIAEARVSVLRGSP